MLRGSPTPTFQHWFVISVEQESRLMEAAAYPDEKKVVKVVTSVK